MKNAKIFSSVLFGENGSADGWQCCWGAPNFPQLPPATPKNPPPFIIMSRPITGSDDLCDLVFQVTLPSIVQ
jgi:hypothetical protein